MIYATKPHHRAAITLVEVIFAIGVIMIGLLGLLSIMPLAGRRAQEAVSFSTGAEMGDAVFKEVQIRGWLGSNSLIDMFASPNTIEFDFANRQLQTTSGTAVNGVCIDPLYCAVQGGSGTSFSSYDNSVFPYYDVNHDPLLDPSNGSAANWPTAIPRLRRVGIASMGAELARTIIQNANDLVVEQPEDRSLAAQLPGISAGSVSYGRRVPSGEFSWLATLVPTANSRYASLSIVVLRNRVVDLDFPTTAPATVTPEVNGVSERVAYVTHAAGFSGGAGGTVHLTASNLTSSTLAPNDWIMLSRQVTTTRAEHRWYRVVAVDAEPDEFVPESDTLLEPSPAVAVPLPAPSGMSRNEEVWRRRVTLDGPDWNFNFLDGSGNVIQTADSSFGDNTYATLMQGVVSVTERLVPLVDL